jgi:hypothetical protein
MSPLFLRLKYVGLCIVCQNTFVDGSSRIKVFEYMFGIEKFRINSFRGKKFAADNKYLCRDIPGEPQSPDNDKQDENIPGGRRFCCLDFAEQLVENPD